jgi:hypothetical protein
MDGENRKYAIHFVLDVGIANVQDRDRHKLRERLGECNGFVSEI